MQSRADRTGAIHISVNADMMSVMCKSVRVGSTHTLQISDHEIVAVMFMTT